MKKVIIEVDFEEGTTEFTVEGIKGPSCTHELKDLQAALGGKVVSSHKTIEYTAHQQQKIGLKH